MDTKEPEEVGECIYNILDSTNSTRGQLNIESWKGITSDNTILQAISGYKLEFLGLPPIQERIPFPYKLQWWESRLGR